MSMHIFNKRLVRRNQSVIKNMQDESCSFGSVKFFTTLETPTGEVSVAVVKPFHLIDIYNERDHIHCVNNKSCDEAEVIPIGDVLGSCITFRLKITIMFVRYPIDMTKTNYRTKYLRMWVFSQ